MLYKDKCPGCGKEFECGGFMGSDGGMGYHMQNCYMLHLQRKLNAKNQRKPKSKEK